MKRILLCLSTLFFSVSIASAHEGKEHKEPMVEGTLTALTGDKATLKTATEDLTVLITPETNFEMGTHGDSAKRSDVKVGEHLMIHGRKIGSGEFQATEIMIHQANTAGEKKMKEGDSHLMNHEMEAPDHHSMDHSK